MSERVFVDANLTIYVTGRDHPLKEPCLAVFRAIAASPAGCWSSAEVLQELLHVLLRRNETARAEELIGRFAGLLGSRIVPLMADDVLWCVNREFPRDLQARDRIHLAVMNRLGITSIVTTDSGFDGQPGITRLDPVRFSDWRDRVFGPE